MAKAKAKKTEAQEAAHATLRHARISPRKARLVLEMIKGQQVEQALQILKYSPKKGARMIEKLLLSAVQNASEKGESDVDNLWVSGGHVNMAKTLKRWMPRAQGRATPIRKRAAHITVVVGER